MLLCFNVQQKASEQRTKARSLSWSLPLSLSQNMLPYVLLSPHSQFMPSSGQCFDVFHAVFPFVFHVRLEEPFRGNFSGTFRVLFPAAKDVLFALFHGAVALSKRVCVCVSV